MGSRRPEASLRSVERVCVFCGASSGRRAAYVAAARAFAGEAAAGGFGALDELAEQLTWSQLGLHAKPVGLLDVEGYWRPLIELARHMTDEGYVREADLRAVAVAAEPGALLEALERVPRPRAKWTRPPAP